ncbi:MAG: GEVED domain-containing protein [Saprospiraceae bacterium]
MKTFYFLCFFLVLSLASNAQPWLKLLPAEKTRGGLTFFDYQKAFNEYWKPFDVRGGYYYENGEKKKAAGWKQFKRWEYEMEGRINPSTGEFPKKTAQEVYNEYFSSRDNRSSRSANWTSLGPSSPSSVHHATGRINCIAFHPNINSTYWVGSPSGGLWMTTNNGAGWTCMTDHNGVLGVSSIVIPPDFATTNTIYISTGDRDSWDNNSIGVLKSTDGGVTWNPTALSYTLQNSRMVNKLIMDPNNTQTLIAATSTGVYKTTDGGVTWNTQLTNIEFIDLEFKPGNFSTLYGSTKNGKIYVSTNGSPFSTPSFNNSSAKRIELAVSPNQPSWVYAVVTNSDYYLNGIYKSIDSGLNYSLVFSGNSGNLLGRSADADDYVGQGYYDLSLGVSPTNANTLLVGGINTWRSLDGGNSWSIVNHWTGDQAQEVHADKHDLVFRSNGELFECNDGGIYTSSNNGTSWTNKTSGLVNSQMYRLSVAQTLPNKTITGLQDNGTKFYDGSIWTDVKSGDGMECLIDYSNVNIQYGASQNGHISRTINQWQNSVDITPNGGEDGAWVTPYIIDPLDPKILYAGYRYVWKSEDRGDNWQQISSYYFDNYIRSMAIAPSNSQVIYVADYADISKTTNGGGNWASTNHNLPTSNAYIVYMTVKNDDPNTIWVAMSGYANAGIYESTDGGIFFTKISNGLPTLPVYTVVQNVQVGSEVELYAGTELGVYYKKGIADWIPYNTGLPNVRIGELEIYYATDPDLSKLRAATYGRGLWETPVEFNPAPMTYSSSTTKQENISSIQPNQLNQEILKIEISTEGNLTPLSVTSFDLNTIGSTNAPVDISRARLYSTGSSNAFNTTTLFGSFTSPNGSFTIAGSKTLNPGKNYFWLSYDVSATATLGNVLDAQCIGLTINNYIVPSVTSPVGSRNISAKYCDAGAVQSNSEYIANVTMGAVSQSSGRGVGSYQDFTNRVIDVELGSPTPISVENGYYYSGDQLLIWVDWNFDGDFSDADETVFVSSIMGIQYYNTTITPPQNAREGIARMRIRLHDTNSGPNYSPCANASYGEVEDYSLHIASPTPCSILNYLAFKAENTAGNYVPLGLSGSKIITADFDDANSTPQPIGFEFEYGCNLFTQFILNTNGFIKLGNIPPSSERLFFSEAQTMDEGVFNSIDPLDVNILCPFNHDLKEGTGSPEYRVYTSGVAPNRVCTIQYQDVREWTTSPAQQYNNMEFQVKLYETSNRIEFIYGDWTPSANGSALKTAACGLKGASINGRQLLTVTKGSAQEWSAAEFSNANYVTGTSFNFGNPVARPKPDPGRTFRFTPIQENDIRIQEIYTLGEASLYYSSPQSIAVSILNTGKTTVTNFPVTLNISGANTFSETKYISQLDFLKSETVTFSPFTPSNQGATNIVIDLPDDDGAEDNVINWTQQTNDFTCNYSSSENLVNGYGFQVAGDDGAFYCKYKIKGTAKVNSIKAFIANNAASVGQTVKGIVLNSSGNVIGTSSSYVIQLTDLGAWHTFSIPSLPTITNADFYAGFGLTAGGTSYYAMGVQEENPSRPNAYYYSNVDGSGLVAMNLNSFPYRFMIGAILSAVPPVAGTASSNSPLCEGNSASVTLTGYTGSIQWQQSANGTSNWTPVSGGSGAIDPNYVSDGLSLTTYYRAEISQPGFQPVYSNVLSVVVKLTPDDATQIIGTDVVCQGQVGVLYMVADIANATSYVWTKSLSGVTGTSDSSSILLTFSASSTSGNISVVGKNGTCTGLPFTLPITVNPQPAKPIVGQIIQPTCAMPTGSAVVSGLPSVGTWTLIQYPGGIMIPGSGSSLTISALPAGTYTFNVVSESGCNSPTSTSLLINPQPLTPDTPFITANEQLLHSDASSGNQWYDQDGMISGATGQDYMAQEGGDYYVIVTLNGCHSAASNSIHIDLVGFESPDILKNIRVYPNPFKDELIIEISSPVETSSVEIINSVGQVLYVLEMDDRLVLQTSQLASGIYLIKIRGRDFLSVRKMIKD